MTGPKKRRYTGKTVNTKNTNTQKSNYIEGTDLQQPAIYLIQSTVNIWYRGEVSNKGEVRDYHYEAIPANTACEFDLLVSNNQMTDIYFT